MFSTSPGFGHFLPVVPLAWAARAAGHEVLVAATGAALQASGRAGLPAVDVRPGPRSERGPVTSALGCGTLPALQVAMPDDRMVARMISAVESWQPDVVVTEFNDFMAPTAAALRSIPVVLHGLGLLHTGSTAFGPPPPVASAFERLGVRVAPPAAAAVVDTCPPSMRDPDRPAAWPMRYVPYCGGGDLPPWLLERASSVRVCVTLGTVVPAIAAIDELTTVIDAVGGLDAEVVLVLGDVDPTPLGPLPGNVRPTAWLPLSELLPTCAAIVHHGGAGTTMTAVAAGVPQLILPYREWEAVVRRGIGLALMPGELSQLGIQRGVGRLLRDPEFRVVADEVRHENEAQPSPADVIGLVERLL